MLPTDKNAINWMVKNILCSQHRFKPELHNGLLDVESIMTSLELFQVSFSFLFFFFCRVVPTSKCSPDMKHIDHPSPICIVPKQLYKE